MEIEIEEEVQVTAQEKENPVHVIILKIHNPNLCDAKSYDLPILGKSMVGWVQNATRDFPTTLVDCGINDDVFTTIMPYLNQSKITVVLYSDTPLLTGGTVAQIVDYFTMKDMRVCKLSRGFVFDTQYFKTASKIFAPQAYNFNEEEFYPAVNFFALSNITNTLKNRIDRFHMNNGVYVMDVNSTVIEPDVVIGRNVIIYPNNYIKGDTVISDSVVLKENNVLESVVLLAGTCVAGSVVKNSVLSENVTVHPYCTILNKSMVGKNSVIHSFVELDNAYIGENNVINSHNKIGKE